MTQQLISKQTCAGAFDTIEKADRAIRLLIMAGFTHEQLAVVCPAEFKSHFFPNAPQTKTPSSSSEATIMAGGAAGATLGGLALAATALTGGAAGLVAAAVLVGGGAIAGAFS